MLISRELAVKMNKDPEVFSAVETILAQRSIDCATDLKEWNGAWEVLEENGCYDEILLDDEIVAIASEELRLPPDDYDSDEIDRIIASYLGSDEWLTEGQLIGATK